MAASVTCTRNTLSAPELDEEQPPIIPIQAATTTANGPQFEIESLPNPVPEKTEIRLKSVPRNTASTGRSLVKRR